MAPWVTDFVKEEGAVTADETDTQELFMHQPDEVSTGRCSALMLNAGREKYSADGSRCVEGNSVAAGKQIARRMGKMRGAIPASVMKLFREKALTLTRKSTQWYARHLRWAQALYSDIQRNENKGQTHVTEKT